MVKLLGWGSWILGSAPRVCSPACQPFNFAPKHPMRLLLAEDDRMIGDSLRQALRLEGHAVDWVYDVAAANAALAAEHFDLLLLDLGLPDKPGQAAQPSAGLACCARCAAGATPHR